MLVVVNSFQTYCYMKSTVIFSHFLCLKPVKQQCPILSTLNLVTKQEKLTTKFMKKYKYIKHAENTTKQFKTLFFIHQLVWETIFIRLSLMEVVKNHEIGSIRSSMEARKSNKYRSSSKERSFEVLRMGDLNYTIIYIYIYKLTELAHFLANKT